ncbi:hypothetical protein KEJ23_06425, partial [Candidatus Bathyarchaeota archaeon]|nr:hypothetical protein [Candidatus Bathyarchaeota archaeon]
MSGWRIAGVVMVVFGIASLILDITLTLRFTSLIQNVHTTTNTELPTLTYAVVIQAILLMGIFATFFATGVYLLRVSSDYETVRLPRSSLGRQESEHINGERLHASEMEQRLIGIKREILEAME